MPVPVEFNQDVDSSREKISVNKSSYNNLRIGFVAAIAVATFFGGYIVATMNENPNSLTEEELTDILSKLEEKPAPKTPSPVPAEQSTLTTGTNIIQLSIHDDPVKGNPDAPITIIEFSDFQCPFCARFTAQTLPALDENYIETGKVKLVFKDLPLRIHSNARAAHIAAECADEAGKFWEFHDILFLQQNQWQSKTSTNLETVLINFATGLGIDREEFKTCIKSGEIAGEVQLDTLEAASNDANGTPTFFIGNENDGYVKVVGAQPYSVFQRIIDDKLES